MAEASNSDLMSTRQQRIAELARRQPQLGFTSLNHFVDQHWLLAAYQRTRKDGAVGVDGQTASAYEARLGDNLKSLLVRAKSGTYRAPPVRRVHIPKGVGRKETRPIGIPTFEDKILQRSVTMLLEAIYEQDFYDCSYGFRPGRSAHQALESLRHQTMEMRGGYILEVDIQKFFDMLDRTHLRAFVERRVRDGVLLRLMGKWLNAGVLAEGRLNFPDTGSPQGGVISPVLSNIYLHYVLDEWFEKDVKPRLQGRAFLVRYADDLVMGFAQQRDAVRMREVLAKRFAKYGLALHPEKTRLVPFGRPSKFGRIGTSEAEPETFDFLGFTHYWGTSRKGNMVVKRRTATDRFRRAVRKVAQWCREHRHQAIDVQHKTLSRMLHGHYGYYGITGNSRALGRFHYVVTRLWHKWLDRRSGRSHMSWDHFRQMQERHPLPPPVVVHSVYRTVANQ
jgi:RNA-directed DNA polymerase